jgi:hypothetical protein
MLKEIKDFFDYLLRVGIFATLLVIAYPLL